MMSYNNVKTDMPMILYRKVPVEVYGTDGNFNRIAMQALNFNDKQSLQVNEKDLGVLAAALPSNCRVFVCSTKNDGEFTKERIKKILRMTSQQVYEAVGVQLLDREKQFVSPAGGKLKVKAYFENEEGPQQRSGSRSDASSDVWEYSTTVKKRYCNNIFLNLFNITLCDSPV